MVALAGSLAGELAAFSDGPGIEEEAARELLGPGCLVGSKIKSTGFSPIVIPTTGAPTAMFVAM